MYSKFILDLYIIYESQSECNPSNSFTLKNCLIGTVKIGRNKIKIKFIYNGSGKAFDRKGSWSFNIEKLWNFETLGADNNSSSHTKNNFEKITFLILGVGPTDGINDSTGAAEKKISRL